jgi:hypothetical protein
VTDVLVRAHTTHQYPKNCIPGFFFRNFGVYWKKNRDFIIELVVTLLIPSFSIRVSGSHSLNQLRGRFSWFSASPLAG